MIAVAFKKSWHHWKVLLKDPAFRISLFAGIALLMGSYVVNYFATVYNDSRVYLSVGDLILDVLPVINMHMVFTWGMYTIIVAIILYPTLFKPELVPFTLKTFAVMIALRSGFILLTNLGPPEGFFYEGRRVGGQLVSHFLFRNDLFFSGHTSVPFLAFLLFYETRYLKWLFFGGSFLMAFTVLAMHIHYSIDVFASFFIAYGTYSVSDRIFNRLNTRFRTRIRLKGWNYLQRLKGLRERRKIRILEKKIGFKTFDSRS